MRSAPVLLLLLTALAAPPCPAQSADGDPPAPLDELAEDRVAAAAHYATAETLFEKGDLQAALRHYQRAWRWDPSARGPLEKIVPLAFSLGRVEEAVRYALLDADSAEPPLLRRLALYLGEQGDSEGSLRLLRMWRDKASPVDVGEEDALIERLMVSLEIARLERATGDPEAASRTIESVQNALVSGDSGASTADRVAAALGGSAADVWERFAAAHFAAGRRGPAKQAVEQLDRTPAAGGRALYWRAEIAAVEGRPLVAYDLLKQCFDTGVAPNGAAPYELLQQVLSQLGDQAGLLRDLERLSESGQPDALFALADAKMAAGDAAAAEEIYRRLLADTAAADDDRRATRAARWLIQRFGEDGRLIDLAELLPTLGASLDDFEPLEPSLAAALVDTRSAGRLLKRFKRLNDDATLDELTAAAWVARTAGSLELAIRLHKASLAKAGERAPNRALSWAVDLLFDDELARAAKAIREGLDQDLWGEDDPEPYFYLATALALEQQHDAALEAAREAAGRAPEMADVAMRVAWVLYNAERVEEAVTEYLRFVDDFADDPDPVTRDALKTARLTLSFIELENDKVPAAVEWLEQVLDEYPSDPNALNDLAYLWAERGLHPKRSVRMAQQAAAAAPDNAAFLDTLAWAHFRVGDLEAAFTAVDRALAVARAAGEDPDGEILEHQGDILAALGRVDEARASWQRAAEAYEAAEHPEQAAAARRKLATPDPAPADG